MATIHTQTAKLSGDAYDNITVEIPGIGSVQVTRERDGYVDVLIISKHDDDGMPRSTIDRQGEEYFRPYVWRIRITPVEKPEGQKAK